jgi:hypothetical protein
VDAFYEVKDENDIKVPLIVEVEDEDGQICKEENPLIHRLNELRPVFPRILPPFIQGVDRQICNYIREDYTYEKIARVMSMTENAVTKRIQRMRNTIEAMRAAGEKV